MFSKVLKIISLTSVLYGLTSFGLANFKPGWLKYHNYLPYGKSKVIHFWLQGQTVTGKEFKEIFPNQKHITYFDNSEQKGNVILSSSYVENKSWSEQGFSFNKLNIKQNRPYLATAQIFNDSKIHIQDECKYITNKLAIGDVIEIKGTNFENLDAEEFAKGLEDELKYPNLKDLNLPAEPNPIEIIAEPLIQQDSSESTDE